jgi:hypothetical protein
MAWLSVSTGYAGTQTAVPNDTATSIERPLTRPHRGNPGCSVAIVVTRIGAVVLLIPLARHTLGIRTIGRAILMLDGAVGAGTFVGFAVALG